ncbi:uncharacterized protein LOC130800104 [Amaranthus tricolor]|uniref:uncharacterized protein LOC130800104 n=1 Tax=Amaranthus tricolor TaxID=29722 RepID=UPI002587B8C2|nr:uncharacterized protein LOC130800104 [Amaranthus tricolor]
MSSGPNDWASDILLNNLSNSNDDNSDEENNNQVHGSSENTPSDSINNMEEDDGDDPRPNLPWLPTINKFNPIFGNIIASKIRATFNYKQDVEGSNWKGVATPTKDFYFNEFKKQYKWDPRLEHFVRRSWKEKAAKRYADMLFKWRRTLKSKPDFKPPSIDNETWARWKADWERLDNKAVSARNSSNRRGGRDKDEATHIGGSVSHARTMRDLPTQPDYDAIIQQRFADLEAWQMEFNNQL